MITEQQDKMENITIRTTTPDDEKTVAQLMEEHWGGEPLIVRTEKFYPSKVS